MLLKASAVVLFCSVTVNTFPPTSMLTGFSSVEAAVGGRSSCPQPKANANACDPAIALIIGFILIINILFSA